jgi:cytochrome c-type biogenesis protein CcmH/NrfG
MRIFKIILLIILSLTGICGILYFTGVFSPAVPALQMSKSQKEQQKHIIDLTNILKSDPQNPEGYYNLGMAYSDIKDYNSAVNELKKAFKLHPKTKYETALAQNLLKQERLDEVFNLLTETGVNDFK